MSETSTTTADDQTQSGADGPVSTVFGYILSPLKWVVVLGVGIGYTAFLGNIVRLHLAQGDIPAVAVTALVYLVIPLAIVGRRFVGRTGSTGGDSGITAGGENTA